MTQNQLERRSALFPLYTLSRFEVEETKEHVLPARLRHSIFVRSDEAHRYPFDFVVRAM
jgi:hypothetical protein